MGNCIFCNGIQQNVFFEIKNANSSFEILKCENCNAYTLDPIPTETELAEVYNTGYYGKGGAKFILFVEYFVDAFRGIRAKRAINRIPQNGTVLDIGCGSGAFLNYLKKRYNFSLSGIEIKGDAAIRAADCNQGFELHIGFLQDIDFGIKTFDLITMYHVFEHLITPKEDIKKISSLIKNNGRLIISMPNINSWQATLFKDKWFHLDFPRHLIFFKPKDFKEVMQLNGFYLESEHYISWEQNPFGYIQSSLNVVCKNQNFLYEFLKTNAKSNYTLSDWFQLSLQILFAGVTLPLFLIIDVFESFFKKSATVEYTFKYQSKND
ncbi:class I SAM-dependent methyltransferase [Flavobacterium jejuense]|uniref:Class I SAM-dependent methyltransferase n=1 Tax=Flavobacterium jejuense TaxID=1544455 RepID=A0ABX0IUQ7_9FLAO|nr:class I SAM-dependent methyltransferase [Flavobacterium jejuense]NHN27443.1 class I SAM-dependent methyltransferase [Flavobacterium jejuense]